MLQIIASTCYKKCLQIKNKICCLRSSKLSKKKLGGVVVIFCDYLNVIKSFFPLCPDAHNPTILLSVVIRNRVSLKMLQKMALDETSKISCLRTFKLSENKVGGILELFSDYLNVIKGFFCFSWMRITQNFHLA